MSLKPEKISDIPEETKPTAKKAFPKGNIYMQMRDELGNLYNRVYPTGYSRYIDWESKTATCPEGVTSVYWKPRKDRFRNPIIHIRFPQSECETCEKRSVCTRHKKGYRAIGIRPQAQYQALQKVRMQQKTQQWKKEYEKRAGIEGTNSQGVRRFGLRQARYIGLTKTHLQHVLTAAAINVVRFSNWVSRVPLAKTRISPFEALRPGCIIRQQYLTIDRLMDTCRN